MTTNLTTAARPPTARSLPEICEAARHATCGECWQVPDMPCTRDPEGDHVARFGRAMRRGLISGAELVAVLNRFAAFTTATVVETPGGMDKADEGCPRCGGVSWGQTPAGSLECARCLWQEPGS